MTVCVVVRKKLIRAPAAVALAMFMVTGNASQIDQPPAAVSDSSADLNLPGDFLQRIADRSVIDAYQVRHYRVESNLRPAPRKMVVAPNDAGRFIKVARSSSEAGQYRAALPASFVPLRGFRAPILERSGETPRALQPPGQWSEGEIAAAECIAQKLAHDGLLSTLAQVIRILDPQHFMINRVPSLKTLDAVGFPIDLIACFSISNDAIPSSPDGVISFIARRLAGGATVESLKPELDKMPFRFVPTHPSFRVATESGEDEPGLLRVQVGGGYDDGVVPGGSIDIICQLVSAFPAVDFLISIPNPYFEPFHQLASQTWRLRRTNHVLLVSEPLAIAAWPQDNGKAGCFTNEASVRPQWATLAPRYANIGEGHSSFQKGESFLMDGLRAAGHGVVHSSLLFQGGNLLAVRNPKSNARVLLIGEAELYRNTALGLTLSQVLEAFRVEFGVDRCLMVPAVSYHLDFDACLRAHDGELVVFVNDTVSAARSVVGLGLDALERSGILDTNAAVACRADLSSGDELKAIRRLRAVIPRRSPPTAGYPASLSRVFVSERSDSATVNFQCFLLALDLIESSARGTVEEVLPDPDPEHAAYLQALRRLDAARQAQAEVFKNQGWKVVAIPSMTDLYRGVNYLNGIHHRHGYVMPAFGGFYAPIDQAAKAAFRRALGPELNITSLFSAESQRHHGGVHCTAAAYPRL